MLPWVLGFCRNSLVSSSHWQISLQATHPRVKLGARPPVEAGDPSINKQLWFKSMEAKREWLEWIVRKYPRLGFWKIPHISLQQNEEMPSWIRVRKHNCLSVKLINKRAVDWTLFQSVLSLCRTEPALHGHLCPLTLEHCAHHHWLQMKWLCPSCSSVSLFADTMEMSHMPNHLKNIF